MLDVPYPSRPGASPPTAPGRRRVAGRRGRLPLGGSRAADAKFLAQRLGVEPGRVRAAREELAVARRDGAMANGSAPTLPLADGEG